MDCCSHEGRTVGDARFEIKKVADGVHAAVAAPAYKVNSNTAIIESDDGVVIVDTHSKPSAARVIVERLSEITTKPVRYVVNTHFHWDHWHGNEVYPAAYPHAEIVTNQLTREAMVRKGLKRIQDHVRQVPHEIAQLKADLATARAPAERARLEAAVRLAESYLAEVRALRPALPTIAFEQTMKLYRRDREIHLLYLGRAHTEGDVFVYLPREKVVVTGDAVIGWTPFMGDGYPEDWVTTLDRLAQLDFTHIIMGHGDVAGRDWLQTFRLRPRHGRRRARRGRRGRHARGSPAARARTARPRLREALFPLRSLSSLAPGSPRQHRAHLHDGELGRGLDIRAQVLHEWGGRLRYETVGHPRVGATDALVRVEACGVGLTVLNYMNGNHSRRPEDLPRIPGHEAVGTVVEVGAAVTTLSAGQRVMSYFYLFCEDRKSTRLNSSH